MRLVDDRRRLSSAKALCLCCGLSLLGFATGTVALRRVLPPPRDDLQHRLAAFAARKDEYDVVIVGSSHVKTQISPALCDHVAQERGVAIRSRNLGVQGLDAIPLLYVVREIAKLVRGQCDRSR